jgi:DNA-binding GntR family transcriptional regulator
VTSRYSCVVGGRDHLRAEVASAVREQILSRQVLPGDSLRLVQLADALGVSITPVREALLLLTQDGWVVHEPNRGFRVAALRRKDVDDTYFMWSIAAGEIAVRAARLATEADVARLRAIDEEIRAAGPADGARATVLNRNLHLIIDELADAPKLVWFAEAARRLIPLRFPDSFHDVPGWAEVNRTEHGPIIDAIAAHDTKSAGEGMAAHLRETGNLLLRWLDSMDFWAPPEGSSAPRRLAG